MFNTTTTATTTYNTNPQIGPKKRKFVPNENAGLFTNNILTTISTNHRQKIENIEESDYTYNITARHTLQQICPARHQEEALRLQYEQEQQQQQQQQEQEEVQYQFIKRQRDSANPSSAFIKDPHNPTNQHLQQEYLLSDFATHVITEPITSTNADGTTTTTTMINPTDLLVDHNDDEDEAVANLDEWNTRSFVNLDSAMGLGGVGGAAGLGAGVFFQSSGFVAQNPTAAELYGGGTGSSSGGVDNTMGDGEDDLGPDPYMQREYSDGEYDTVATDTYFANTGGMDSTTAEDGTTTTGGGTRVDNPAPKKLNGMHFGFNLLIKAGWNKQTGLGAEEQGIVDPIKAKGQAGHHRGIGFSTTGSSIPDVGPGNVQNRSKAHYYKKR